MGNVLEYQRRAAGQGDDIGVDDADLIEDDLKWLAVSSDVMRSVELVRATEARACKRAGTQVRRSSLGD